MSTPDGLDPPGEQLGLFPEPAGPEVVETVVTVHRVSVAATAWRCVCGAGTATGSRGRAHAAAQAHMAGVRRRALKSLDRP